MVCHHPDKFGDQKRCDNEDIMSSICQKCYVDLWVDVSHGKSPPRHVLWPLV